MSDAFQRIRVIRDFPPGRRLGPVLRAGQIVWGRLVEPAPGFRGWRGWTVRVDNSGFDWALEDGVDAVLDQPERAGASATVSVYYVTTETPKLHIVQDPPIPASGGQVLCGRRLRSYGVMEPIERVCGLVEFGEMCRRCLDIYRRRTTADPLPCHACGKPRHECRC